MGRLNGSWLCGECQNWSAGEDCDHCGQLRSVSMAQSTNPRLLADGAVLVAFHTTSGQTITRRYEPGETEHGRWIGRLDHLEELSEKSKTDARRRFAGWVVAAVVIPVTAIVGAIVYLRRGALTSAVAILLAAGLSAGAYVVLAIPLIERAGQPSATDLEVQLAEAVEDNDKGSFLSDTDCRRTDTYTFECTADYEASEALVKEAAGTDFDQETVDLLVKQSSGPVTYKVDFEGYGDGEFEYAPVRD